MKKYPKPRHCAGLVRISPGQFTPGPEKVGIGPIPVQKLLGLDWTGLGRTRSGLVKSWTGGIIATSRGYYGGPGFSCGKTCCHGSCSVPTWNRNQTRNLKPLITQWVTEAENWGTFREWTSPVTDAGTPWMDRSLRGGTASVKGLEH